jgi:hypothetical protein
MAHLSLCSSQDDTMPNYPNCDCGDDYEQATKADAGWTIFNSGGAVVGEDLTLEEVRDYMTPERFERGWNAVYCINVTSQAQLDKLDMEKL